MLEFFQISHATDGRTVCRIYVDVLKRQCGVTVTVAGRIVAQGDETDVTVKSFTSADWRDPDKWSDRAATIAKQYSPFWRGETAA